MVPRHPEGCPDPTGPSTKAATATGDYSHPDQTLNEGAAFVAAHAIPIPASLSATASVRCPPAATVTR
jgi:hypothetical protein